MTIRTQIGVSVCFFTLVYDLMVSDFLCGPDQPLDWVNRQHSAVTELVDCASGADPKFINLCTILIKLLCPELSSMGARAQAIVVPLPTNLRMPLW
jgi:hypothetical protein